MVVHGMPGHVQMQRRLVTCMCCNGLGKMVARGMQEHVQLPNNAVIWTSIFGLEGMVAHVKAASIMRLPQPTIIIFSRNNFEQFR